MLSDDNPTSRILHPSRDKIKSSTRKYLDAVRVKFDVVIRLLRVVEFVGEPKDKGK